MKSVYLLIMLLSFASVSFSQNPEEWQALEFKTNEDYKAHEDKILECAKFVLSVPAEPTDPARQSALSAVAKWMSGTPDYDFIIDESIGKLMEKNEAVLSIYMAAMTKNVLEHKDAIPSAADMKLDAFEKLLIYSENANNKVPITKELKKAIAARKKGKLKEYLGI